MCDQCFRCAESEEKALLDLEALIRNSSPDQVKALHFVSAGSVRENVEQVVVALISKGNAELAATFPDLLADLPSEPEASHER
mgnify:CR=1 FL=1